MTRKSKRELERTIDDLEGGPEPTLQEAMWADLKDYYGADLTPRERRALDVFGGSP